MEDRFNEYLATQDSHGTSDYGKQSVSLICNRAGLDLVLLKNLRQSYTSVVGSTIPDRIYLTNYSKEIRIHQTASGCQWVEVTRWVPRYDNQHLIGALFAYASLGEPTSDLVDLSDKGQSLFDVRLWTQAFKAVKTYKKLLTHGKPFIIRYRKSWPKGKLIDFRGKHYYTLDGGGAFTDYEHMLFKGLTDIWTMRVMGGQAVGDGSGHHVSTVQPNVMDESTTVLHWKTALYPLKHNVKSAFSTAIPSLSAENIVTDTYRTPNDRIVT